MNILDEAKELVYGDRQKAYGHPRSNFWRTAVLWDAHLRGQDKLLSGQKITREDVGWMLMQVKQAREMEVHTRDNLVDAAGYIATAARVHRDDE